ncbi:MAG: hypothetical protein Q9219_002107 [cf. Caloplaca sp. 3 TL-2023]
MGTELMMTLSIRRFAVALASGVQTFYNQSPPEAVQVKPQEGSGSLLPNDSAPRRLRRRFLILTIFVLYVTSADNSLRCIDLVPNLPPHCQNAFADLGDIHIAAGSSHISGYTLYDSNTGPAGLMLIYQDMSGQTIFMYGRVSLYPAPENWTWRNMTGYFNAQLSAKVPDGRMALPCRVDWNKWFTAPWYILACYVDNEPGTASTQYTALLNFNIDVPTGNLTASSSGFGDVEARPYTEPSNEIGIFGREGEVVHERMWINQSILRIYEDTMRTDTPKSPETPFPFNRLTTLYLNSTKETYIYHQISDTVIAEELWDEVNKSWFTKNITIPT